MAKLYEVRADMEIPQLVDNLYDIYRTFKSVIYLSANITTMNKDEYDFICAVLEKIKKGLNKVDILIRIESTNNN